MLAGTRASAKPAPPKNWRPTLNPLAPVCCGVGATGERRAALLTLGPLDTICHLLRDANRDLHDPDNPDRHPSR